jgi:hypothetical protein
LNAGQDAGLLSQHPGSRFDQDVQETAFAQTDKISTSPWPPLTRTRSPVFRRMVASPQPTTAGIPSSRATMAAWLSGAHRSVTIAAARGKSGVQPMLVNVVTRISPAWSWLLSSRRSRRRTVPSTTPSAPAKPVIASPAPGSWAAAGAFALKRERISG